MGALLGLTRAFAALNGALLALGRWLGAVCMAAMVTVILAQVFFRYVLNNALPWPEEASRFLMLWATGLMAATAFRRGGFVSVDMVVRFLPRLVAGLLSFVLLLLCLLVLVIGLQISWSEVTGIGGRFATDSLNYPTSWDFSQWVKVPRSWQMASMFVGISLLVLVCVELILRSLATLLGLAEDLPLIAEEDGLGVE